MNPSRTASLTGRLVLALNYSCSSGVAVLYGTGLGLRYENQMRLRARLSVPALQRIPNFLYSMSWIMAICQDPAPYP